MFDFELLKNEKIEIISDEGLLEYRSRVKEVSVVITNQRFLIFSTPKDIESFRDSYKLNKKEIIFEVKIDDIETIVTGQDFDKYILKDTNYFYLHDDMIRKYLTTYCLK